MTGKEHSPGAYAHTIPSELSEKEKAAQGAWYDAAHDRTLLAEMAHAHLFCQKYNQVRADDADTLSRILRGFLGKTGERFSIIQPFFCDYGYHIFIGEDFFANTNFVVLDAADVVIGDRVFIGPDCGLYTAIHPIDAGMRAQGLERALPIHIGNDVWIGGGVKVFPGVTIGSGSVIGAGSVVTRDIPPGVVAAGNPCRVLRPAAP